MNAPASNEFLQAMSAMDERTPAPAAGFDKDRASIFRSFWIGGYESSCHLNHQRQRLDLLAATQHDVQAASDYGLLRSVGMATARDALRWPMIDRGGKLDFSSWLPMVEAAHAQGVQVVWDLCHFGWPDDLDVFSAAFIERFARFCAAATETLSRIDPAPPMFVPVNEISFLSWAGGEVGWINPYAHGRGFELKQQLVRAGMAGMDAVRSVRPDARFAHVEPVIHIVGRDDDAVQADEIRQHREAQFQAIDLYAGKLCPELGGGPDYVDVVGANFYHDNQWELHGAKLQWHAKPRDQRWLPLHALLQEIAARYARPIFISETGHFGAGRATWLDEIVDEVLQAERLGVRVEGLCLYPIIDRPDWENPAHWHHVGLWDLVAEDGLREPHLQRVLHTEYWKALQSAQAALSEKTVRVF